MNPGRNAKKRMGATATLLVLVGAAFVAAVPASAALNLGGATAGGLDAVWGAASGASGGGGDAGGQADGSMAGSVSSAWQGAADVQATPPDPQPYVDEASRLAAQLAAEAQAQANGALAQKDNLRGAGALKWGLSGSGAGGYDVVLGGDYTGGLAGLATASGGKTVDHRVDLRGHQAAAAGATGQVEGAVNEIIGMVEAVYGKLHASFDVGLDGAAQALGSIGMDIAGIFGFQQGAELVNADSLAMRKRVDVAAPAMAFQRADLPDVALPDLAVSQGGEVAADAAATASGIIRS